MNQKSKEFANEEMSIHNDEMVKANKPDVRDGADKINELIETKKSKQEKPYKNKTFLFPNRLQSM